ncbi:MAG: LuxR C-terminal-related transcriptional regulator [Candidatus Dormiibacterota bacterium]
MAVPEATLRLTGEERRALEQIAATPRTASIGRRARILLLAADGMSNKEISSALSTSRGTVLHWRTRFAEEGPKGVLAIRPGRGRKPRIDETTLRRLISATMASPPPDGERWTCRRLAGHLGVSPATISRVWRDDRTPPTSARDLPARGRKALAKHAWQEAYELFVAADAAGVLDIGGIMDLAEAADWCGQTDECRRAWERAHAALVGGRDQPQAAYVAVQLSRHYWDMAKPALASGWLRRAERHLANEADCPERGMLATRLAYVALQLGNPRVAIEHAERAEAIAVRWDAPEMALMALHLRGQALVRLGDAAGGLELIDEACAAAVGGELGPEQTGLVYCWTISACRDLGDFERAAQLTDATIRWCDDNSIPAFPGICRIYRAEIFRMRGALGLAEDEALAAAAQLARFALRRSGSAFNEVGLVRLRRGDLDGAADAFRRARELGHRTEPGQALLLLARGNRRAALASVARALRRESENLMARGELLPALIEIAIAAGDLAAAADASKDLDALAASFDRPVFAAAAAGGRGALLLAQGGSQQASTSLQHALEVWMQLDAPYEAAKTRVLLSRARRIENDTEGAGVELEVALQEFLRMGALRDSELARRELSSISRRTSRALTSRQLTVAGLVADGLTNRDIARRMFISERTAEYHVRQIMNRLGFDSRAQIASWHAAYLWAQ